MNKITINYSEITNKCDITGLDSIISCPLPKNIEDPMVLENLISRTYGDKINIKQIEKIDTGKIEVQVETKEVEYWF